MKHLLLILSPALALIACVMKEGQSEGIPPGFYKTYLGKANKFAH
jgi:hypothetical protein